MTATSRSGRSEDRARRGAAAGARAGLVTQLLSVAVTVLLARVLTPDDFGLVTVAQSAIGLVALLVSVGPASTLVQRDDVDEHMVHTVFSATLLLASGVSLLTFFAAPLLASAVGASAATPLLRVLTLSLFLQVLSGVPRALLIRRMEFTAVYRADVAAMVVYAGLQVGLALGGAGAMAVAVGQVCFAATLLCMLTPASGLRPRPVLQLNRLRKDARFLGGLASYQLTTYAGKNVDYWVTAHVLGTVALGQYYVAFVLPNVLRQRVSSLGTEVLLPLLAGIKHDRAQLGRMYLRTCSLTAVIVAPVMAGLAVCAPDVLDVFFGDQWQAAATPLRFLAAAAAIEALIPLAHTLLVVLNKPHEGAVVQGVRAAVLASCLVGLAITGRASLTTTAASVCVSTAVALVLSSVLVRRHTGAGLRGLVGAAAAPAAASLLMVGAIITVRGLSPDLPSWVSLTLFVPLGAAVYAGAGALLRPAHFAPALSLVLSVLPRTHSVRARLDAAAGR